jgi:hypothetical protein
MLIVSGPVAAQTELPLFDGHIHYSDNVWQRVSEREALQLMDGAGIKRAILSSVPNEGTERLYRMAPQRLIPFLRPYPDRAGMKTWHNDPAAIEYVRRQLSRLPYRGIGEFHIAGDVAGGKVMVGLIGLAREHGLVLHAHADEVAIRHILARADDLTVIWAHAGFHVRVATLRELLGSYPGLVLELSFRAGITREDGRLAAAWRELFVDYPDRFLVGMDSYIPARWVMLDGYAEDARDWLQQLPEPVARRIAWSNAEKLFAEAQARY